MNSDYVDLGIDEVEAIVGQNILPPSEARKGVGRLGDAIEDYYYNEVAMIKDEEISRLGKIVYTPRSTHIKSDFRGFLVGGGWLLYIGDNEQIYTRIDTLNEYGSHEEDEYGETGEWDWFYEWESDSNTFGVPYLIDITHFFCSSSIVFVNWNYINPLEVK